MLIAFFIGTCVFAKKAEQIKMPDLPDGALPILPNGNPQWFFWYERVCPGDMIPEHLAEPCNSWYWGKKYNTWTPWYYRACLTGQNWAVTDQKYCEQFYEYIMPKMMKDPKMGWHAVEYNCADEEEELAPALQKKEDGAKVTSVPSKEFEAASLAEAEAAAAEDFWVTPPPSPFTDDDNAPLGSNAATKDLIPSKEWAYSLYYDAVYYAEDLFEDDWDIVTDQQTSGGAVHEHKKEIVTNWAAKNLLGEEKVEEGDGDDVDLGIKTFVPLLKDSGSLVETAKNLFR